MRKTLTALSLSAISLLLAGSSVFASSSLIDGNGAGSNNTVVSKNKTHASVNQSNDANFHNKISLKSSSGKNKTNKNTGGDVSVGTGDTSSSVDVANQANVNTASDPSKSCCPCQENQGDLTITNNGADSTNKIISKNKCSTNLTQSNDADFTNKVNISSNTGGNSTSKNTGGSVDVTTGSSDSTVTISNSANVNQAN